MNITDIIDEELNTKFVNKEIAGLESIKAQLADVSQKNPLVAQVIAKPVGEIEAKLNGLKFAIVDYEKKKKGEKQSGVGTQTPAPTAKTAAPIAKPPAAIPAKTAPVPKIPAV